MPFLLARSIKNGWVDDELASVAIGCRDPHALPPPLAAAITELRPYAQRIKDLSVREWCVSATVTNPRHLLRDI